MNLSVHLLILLASLGASLATVLLLQAVQRGNVRFPIGKLDRRVADAIFCAVALVYLVTFSALSILRHLSFNTDGYDMSIFDQVIWNSLRGRLLQTSILPDVTLLLSQRFSPILLAFVPLYAVWSSPIVLMVVQTVGITLAAFPIYWLARARVGNLLALAVVLAYFLCPALQGVNLYEFHEIALAIPLFSFATFFVLRQRYAPALVCLGLTLLVKEDMAFVVIAMGLYMLLVQRKMRLGLGITVFGTVWGALLLQYIIPYFSGSPLGTGNYYYFGLGIAAGRGRYDYLGHSFFDVVTTLITRPGFVLQHLLVLPKSDYVLSLLTPLALLPLFGAELGMLALPTLGISLLSDYAPQFSIDYHYSASLLPFLFFAMTLGLPRLARWVKVERAMALTALVVTASALGYYFLAPGPLAQRFDARRYTLDAHTAIGHALAARIPDDAIVVAQTGLVPHLSERRGIYEFPAILDYCQAEYLIADTTRFPYRQYEKGWGQWFATKYFEIVAQPDSYLLAKRKTPDQSLQIRFGDQMTLLAYTLPLTETVRGGQRLCPVIAWRADQDLHARYVVQAQLEDAQGHVYAHDEHEPRAGLSPTDQWQRDQRVEDNFTLRMSPTIPSGDYQITISVYDSVTGKYLPACSATNQNLDTEPVVATVRVEKNKTSVTASQLQIGEPLFVDMAEMRVLGFAPLVRETAVGTSLPVGIYWRARGKPRGDYEVAVQLRDLSGRVLIEQASRPANDTYPTMEWNLGEVLLDWHDLFIPEDFAVGEYKLGVVLREVASKAVIGDTLITPVRIKAKD